MIMLLYPFGSAGQTFFSLRDMEKVRLMADERRNNWSAKIKRTFTAVLPVSKRRKGQCANCGACCRLPKACPFLRYRPDGKSYCLIYPIRPLNCRKYPRTEAEFITEDTCGYRFD
jgi:hypothetical protein